MKNLKRRDFLRLGGLGLCGVGMLDLIRATHRLLGTPLQRRRPGR